MSLDTAATDSSKATANIHVRRGLLHSTLIVSVMTMISRVTGFVRDVIIAHHFGALAGVDAFFMAFKIPNFMRRLFAEGAFSQAFVPVLAEYKNQSSHDEVKVFINRITGTLGSILLIVTFLTVLLAPLFVVIFAPGFLKDPQRFSMASEMLRVTFPYLMLISLTAMAGGVLNTYSQFAVPAFTPVFLNLSLIVAALFVAPYFQHPVEALAWGVFFAGIIQLLFQLPFLFRIRLLPWPEFCWRDEGVKKVMRLMIPGIFGVSVAQVNLLLDTTFASFLPAGSVSWLFYSDRLMNFPLGVFGVAIATVILPNLSREHTEQSPKEFSKTIDWAVRNILLIAIPSTLGLFLLAGPLFVTLFNYGKFTVHDVLMARLSLMAFAVGIPSFMLVKIFAAGFYAKQNVKTPVKVGIIAMISNVVLNLLLIFPLAHAGIALATSLAAYINLVLLFILLRKGNFYFPQEGWLLFGIRITIANLLVTLWLVWAKGDLQEWFHWDWHQRYGHLITLVVVAVLLYIGSLLLSGMRLRDIKR